MARKSSRRSEPDDNVVVTPAGRSRDDAGRDLLDRAAKQLRRATLIPVLLLVPLIFLPLRNPAEALADRSVNVALHLVATLLVFALARRLGMRALVAPATALLFAVHPVHVETVAAPAGRTELLAAVLSVAALLAFTHAGPWRICGTIVSRGRAAAHAAALLAGICLLAALSASPTAMAVPALMLGLDRLFRARGDAGRWPWWLSRAAPFAPAAAAVVGYLALRSAGISWHAPVPQTTAGTAGLPAALALLARHVGSLFYPVNPPSHPGGAPLHPPTGLFEPLPLLGVAILGFLFWVAARPLLRQQRTGFESRASSATLLFLLPYAVLAGLATGERFVFAERFLYFPSVGFCMLLALAIGAVSTGRLPGREPRRSGPPSGGEVRLAVFTLAAMISGFSILTWARCLEWRDIGPTQGTVSRAIRFGENGSSCAGGFPSTIQRDR